MINFSAAKDNKSFRKMEKIFVIKFSRGYLINNQEVTKIGCLNLQKKCRFRQPIRLSDALQHTTRHTRDEILRLLTLF